MPDQRITVTQRVRGDVRESERSGKAVWDVITSVDTDRTLPAADPHDALSFTPHRWVLDRRTTAPVHCCGAKPRIQGEAYLKFPFDVRKRAYRWWDNTLGDTVVLRYRGTEKVLGHTGYRFTGSVPPTRTGTRLVPGRLVGLPGGGQVAAEEWYANHGVELIVDQRTGRVLYAQTGPRQTLRARAGPRTGRCCWTPRRSRSPRRPSGPPWSRRRTTATGCGCSARPCRSARRWRAVCSPRPVSSSWRAAGK